MWHKISLWGLWISTIVILLMAAVQALSGNWILLFFILPDGPEVSPAFIQAMAALTNYHIIAGFALGGVSILVLVFAFLTKSNIFVRIFAVVGLAMVVLAALGGFWYVNSGLRDRWPLGQMMDAFVGVFGSYLIQLFFMNKAPRFPWQGAKAK